MSTFSTSMFVALRAAERVIVDGLHVKSFQLEGAEGGAGVLHLEDGTAVSFANQDITIIQGYSAFHTGESRPHSIDFMMSASRALQITDVREEPGAPAQANPLPVPRLRAVSSH